MAAAILVIGTVVAAAGQIKQAQDAAAIQRYNADVAEQQRIAGDRAAGMEIAALQGQSAFEKQKLQRSKEQMLGRQKAAYAKSGVRLDEGSPLEVMADTASQYELDIRANEYNTRMAVLQTRYNQDATGRRLKSESAASKLMAKRTAASGYISASGTLLKGAATYYGAGAN